LDHTAACGGRVAVAADVLRAHSTHTRPEASIPSHVQRAAAAGTARPHGCRAGRTYRPHRRRQSRPPQLRPAIQPITGARPTSAGPPAAGVSTSSASAHRRFSVLPQRSAASQRLVVSGQLGAMPHDVEPLWAAGRRPGRSGAEESAGGPACRQAARSGSGDARPAAGTGAHAAAL